MLKQLFISKAHAAMTTDPIGGTVFNNLTIGGLFTMATNLLIIIGLGLVLVFLALGFIKFITSKGDKVETDTAQKWVTYAVLGGVGLFAVYAIKSVIINLVGGSDPLSETNVPSGK